MAGSTRPAVRRGEIHSRSSEPWPCWFSSVRGRWPSGAGRRKRRRPFAAHPRNWPGPCSRSAPRASRTSSWSYIRSPWNRSNGSSPWSGWCTPGCERSATGALDQPLLLEDLGGDHVAVGLMAVLLVIGLVVALGRVEHRQRADIRANRPAAPAL